MILDAIAKEGLIDSTDFVFLDTLHLVRPERAAVTFQNAALLRHMLTSMWG